MKVRGEAAFVRFILLSSNASHAEGVARQRAVGEVCPDLVQIARVGGSTESFINSYLLLTCRLLRLVVVSEERCDPSKALTQDSAHSGLDFELDKVHGPMEFCTIELQITLVVYRA